MQDMKGKGLGVWSTEVPLPSPLRDHTFIHTEWKRNLNQATDEAWSSYWIWFFSWGQNKFISLSPGLTQFCRSVIWQALLTTRWNKIMPSWTQTSVRWYAGLKLGYLLMWHLASHCYWVSGQMASLWPLLEEHLPTSDPPNITSYNLTFLLPGNISSLYLFHGFSITSVTTGSKAKWLLWKMGKPIHPQTQGQPQLLPEQLLASL